MALLSVQVENLRCFQHLQFCLDPQTSLIFGRNASGKSTVLEAIYILGRGRSFRTSNLGTAIRHDSQELRVVGRVQSSAAVGNTIGVEAKGRATVARIGGRAVESLAELSTAFPVQVLEPGVHKLVEEGPVRRRRFLDWGVFHVEPRYLEQWHRFQRALKQRNAALRQLASDAELDSWDQELAGAGEDVTRARSAYLSALRPTLMESVHSFLPTPIELECSHGWPQGRDLATALAEARPRDRRRKASTVGPQRADLLITSGGRPVRDIVSRGEQKLLASALILGQLRYHAKSFGMRPTLLMDDPAAELDEHYLKLLVQYVRGLDAQLVITALRQNFQAFGQHGAMFHVEQGELTRL